MDTNFVPQINFQNNYVANSKSNNNIHKKEDPNVIALKQYHIPLKKNTLKNFQTSQNSISNLQNSNLHFNQNSSTLPNFFKYQNKVDSQSMSRQYSSSNLVSHDPPPTKYYNNIPNKNIKKDMILQTNPYPENQFQNHLTSQQELFHNTIPQPQTYYYEKNVEMYPINDHNMIHSDYNLAEEVILEND